MPLVGVLVPLVGFVALGGLVFAQAASPPYALVGKGGIGQYKWVSWLERSEARQPQRDVTCISIATEEPSRGGAEGSETYECVRVRPDVPATQAISNDSPGRRRRTVVIMLFAPSARRLELDLGALGHRSIKLRRISDSKARHVGIEPVGYWSHAFKGHFCMGRFSVYDGLGVKLSDTGSVPCTAP